MVSAEPTNGDEAREKALYLMAILMANGEGLDRQQAERAAASLTSYRREMSVLLASDPR
jgi:hypothetical protein